MSYVNYNKVAEAQAKPKQNQNGVRTKTIALFEQYVPPVEEPVVKVVEPVVETPKPEVVGVVVDCAKLNVRAQPNPRATVVCVIPQSSEVTVDEAESTEEFYKVCTAAGAEGFCMKEFIELK
jgi:hypothetical protein